MQKKSFSKFSSLVVSSVSAAVISFAVLKQPTPTFAQAALLDQPRDDIKFRLEGRRCGTRPVSEAQRADLKSRESRFRAANRTLSSEQLRPVEIPVYFHVIHKGDNGKVDKTRIEKQITVLNKTFGPHGFEFSLKEINYYDNAQWFEMNIFSSEEYEAKRTLKVDPKRNLNFYTAQPPGNTLGWATFPHELGVNEDLDGVVVLHSTLPDGSMKDYNLGDTAVHEVGHWLGLFHTFGENPNDSCLDTDEVEDTPVHQLSDSGTPDESTDTCPSKGNDPVHNFMNYVHDAHMDTFTNGQVERMHLKVAQHRPWLIPTSSRAEIKQIE